MDSLQVSTILTTHSKNLKIERGRNNISQLGLLKSDLLSGRHNNKKFTVFILNNKLCSIFLTKNGYKKKEYDSNENRHNSLYVSSQRHIRFPQSYLNVFAEQRIIESYRLSLIKYAPFVLEFFNFKSKI